MVAKEVERASKDNATPPWPPDYTGAYHGLGFAPEHPGPGITCSKRGCNYALGHKTKHEGDHGEAHASRS